MSLLSSTALPDGTFILQDSDFDKRLHEGDPTVGWTGDERLFTAFNSEENRIEIWRLCEDDVARMVMRSRSGVRVMDTGALRFLAEHDSQSRRAFDPYADVRNANLAQYKRADDLAAAQTEEFAEKLQHALRKDIGHLEGGLTKKYH